MPKKSRKEKMLAALRNRQQTPPAGIKHIQATNTQTVTSVPSDTNTQFFKADMKKSITLIMAIIGLEIIFYFASMSTSLQRILKF